MIPPGHIFLQYRNPDTNEVVNIETTARGIDLPSKHYLGLQTKEIPEVNMKEVIGLSFKNLGLSECRRGNFEKGFEALTEYSKYYSEDNEILGYVALLTKREKLGRSILKKVNTHPSYSLVTTTLAEDVLHKRISVDALNTLIFEKQPETRKDYLQRKENLLQIVEENPKSRDALFLFALTASALYQNKEAIQALEKYHALDPSNPLVECYLTHLFLEQQNFSKAWHHFALAKELYDKQDTEPKELDHLQRVLSSCCFQ